MRVRACRRARVGRLDLAVKAGSSRSFHDVGALRAFSLRSFAFDMKMSVFLLTAV